MKSKRILGSFLSAVMLFGALCGTTANVQAEEPAPEPMEPVFEWYLPKTIKVGDWIQDINPNKDNPYVIGRVSNLPNGFVGGTDTNPHIYLSSYDIGDGPAEVINGTAEIRNCFMHRFCAPGKDLIQVEFSVDDQKYDPIGEPYEITVEEPIIKTNAPDRISMGESLNFTTELTNTSLTNEKVAPYLDPENYDHFFENILGGTSYLPDNPIGGTHIAYLPKVEVIEGQELVEQSNQDYSNILNSSETLSFIGTGTVKLKITYQQIMTQWRQGKWEYDENNEPIGLLEDYRYNPTTTVTINVTEPPVSLTDEKTGIQVDAEGGIIPADTSLKVEKATGEQYTTVSKSLKDKAEKFEAFDLSLLSNGKEVQPNGKVKITMPVPSGYDTEQLSIYCVADDGTLTQLGFTLSDDKKLVSFESDDLSVYAITQLKQQNTSDGNEDSGNQQGGTDSPNTDDTTSAFPAFIFFIAASMLMCTIVFLRKRRTNN